MKDTIWIKKGRFTPLAILLMLALPLTTSVICLCFGRMNVPVGEVLTALRTALTGGSAANVQNYSIVINLRLPRILMAIIVGAGLTCAGNTFQSLFSNPLATPDILGVTSGTCVGAILAIILSCSILETQLIALVFGLASVCFTLKLQARTMAVPWSIWFWPEPLPLLFSMRLDRCSSIRPTRRISCRRSPTG